MWRQKPGLPPRRSAASRSAELRVDKLSAGQRFVLELPDGEVEVVGTRFRAVASALGTEQVRVSEGRVALRLAQRVPLSLAAGESWERATEEKEAGREARRRRAALLLAVAALMGCAAERPPVARPRLAPAEVKARFAHDPSALHRSLDHYDFATHTGLLQRIVASPFQYFRFTNPGFAAAICAAFEDILPALPAVNLHGDAHLEQFAVTDASFGLVDFDDAVGGPAVIDLLRFGVSLHIAAGERGWTADEALDRFFAGYQAALEDRF